MIDGRVKQLNKISPDLENDAVVYWMSRDQRVNDNWALIFAQQRAFDLKKPLQVVFSLRENLDQFSMSERTVDFMLEGLAQVEQELAQRQIPFTFLVGDPAETVPEYVSKNKSILLVSDFSPLKSNQAWNKAIAAVVKVPFYQVDAHNIIPVWLASNKQELAARTFRIKVKKRVTEFITDFPRLEKHLYARRVKTTTNWKTLRTRFTTLPSSFGVHFKSGESAARESLNNFLMNDLSKYAEERNNPNSRVASQLSPYLHFGQISAQRVVYNLLSYQDQQSDLTLDDFSSKSHVKVKRIYGLGADADAFFEEVVVRRELAENFCYYNKNYDQISGFPEWAQVTLKQHQKDTRKFLYSYQQFEAAETHDPLWNAAQKQVLATGKMHSYLRMYWAKKILEWTESPKQALEIAIKLNDIYELDGRDPNGYVGVAWSIGGLHDRPWRERDVFGTVRYMALSGAKKKFDVDAYIEFANRLVQE